MRPTLPGVLRSMDLDPPPRWPVALRNTRALHGMLSNRLNLAHRPGSPPFSLLPWPGGCGWAAHFEDDGAARLPSSLDVHVFNRPRTLRLGPPTRLLAPSRAAPGQHLLCLDTRTPVVVRHSGIYREAPEAGNFASAVALSPRNRAAVGAQVEPAALGLELLHCATRPTITHVGGHWGVVVGWSGRLVISCNEVGRYWLEVAACLGVGGRTALGFGRVTIRPSAAVESR